MMFKLSVKKILYVWPLLLGASLLWASLHYRLFINLSSSLPQKYWIVALKQLPQRGNYVCFKVTSELAKEYDFPEELTLTKQAAGIPGDRVTRQERNFYINHQYVAAAKTHSLKGEPLALGPIGVLGAGQYYVTTPHPDSFDSRYQKMGWINANQIVGVAYPLW